MHFISYLMKYEIQEVKVENTKNCLISHFLSETKKFDTFVDITSQKRRPWNME